MLVKKGGRITSRNWLVFSTEIVVFQWSQGIPSEHPLSLRLRQPDSAQQIVVAGVRVHPVPERVHCEIGQGSSMLLITLFQQTERIIFVAEARIDYARPIEIDIRVRGQILKFLGDL